MHYPHRSSLLLLTLLLVSLIPAAVHAQGLALNRFEPAPAGDRMFGVASPYAAGEATPHLMLLADYARNPLVLRRVSTDENIGSVVSHQLFLHANASVALWNRLLLNADLPVAILQAGDDPTSAGATVSSPSATELADLRLSARVVVLGDYHDAVQLAVGGSLWMPTGADDSYVGTGQVRGMPQLIAGGVAGRVLWSAEVGVDLRKSQAFAGVSQGTSLRAGAGLGYLLDAQKKLQLSAELTSSFTLEAAEGAAKDEASRTTNAEALFGLRYRLLRDVEVGAGAGPGLTRGLGTPDLRAVAMIAYSPAVEERREGPRDRDGDGIFDPVDACPDVPGDASDDPKKHGCPPPSDRDGDGIADADDACPDVAGVASADRAKHGCPPDRDGDGIIDAEDACPDVPGVKDADPKKHGCPPDRDGDGVLDADDACPDLPGLKTADPATNGCPGDSDGDGIRDDEDACPLEKGKPDADPKKHGCPTLVRVTQEEIVILQQVQFRTASAAILPASDELLQQVADVLREHPEITRVEVQGHTDNRGGAGYNQRLSQRRADSVVRWLTTKGGIEASRLTPKGFGQEMPIDENTTAEGRQRNRRVQFKVLEKSEAKK